MQFLNQENWNDECCTGVQRCERHSTSFILGLLVAGDSLGVGIFSGQLSSRKTSNYVVMEKVGRGKYSDCYRGMCLTNGRECCVKVIKPIRLKKIQRFGESGGVYL